MGRMRFCCLAVCFGLTITVAVTMVGATGKLQEDPPLIAWVRQAAMKGNATAMEEMGYFYAGGWYMSRNYRKAMAWFRKSAVKGNAKAMYEIGNLYYKGLVLCHIIILG